MMAGRNTDLTPELQKRLVALLKKGNHVSTCCKLVGIHVSTYCNWVNRAKDGESPFLEFLEAVEAASAHAEVQALSVIEKAAMRGDWRAAQVFLERRFPRRWAKKEAPTVSLKVTGAITAAEAQARELERAERELGITGGDAVADDAPAPA